MGAYQKYTINKNEVNQCLPLGIMKLVWFLKLIGTRDDILLFKVKFLNLLPKGKSELENGIDGSDSEQCGTGSVHRLTFKNTYLVSLLLSGNNGTQSLRD